MSDQAQRIKKNAWAIVFFVWAGGGLFFGYYMWKSTPDVDPRTGLPLNNSNSHTGAPNQGQIIQSTLPVLPGQPSPPVVSPNGRPAPSMTLGVEKRAEGVVAIVILKNNTNVAMVVPETIARDPLYKITLKYGPGNSPPAAELPAKTTSAFAEGVAQAVLFNSEHDAVFVLDPGNSHVLTIPLQAEYDLNPGKYDLTVRFQPTNIFPTGRSSKLPPFNVSPAMATTNFVLPLPEAPLPQPVTKTE